MSKILLITQEKHYKTSEARIPDVYASGQTKWLKIFKALGAEFDAEMYSFRPEDYSRRRFHSENIKIIGEKELKKHKFGLVYVHRQESLAVFNSLNITFDKSLLWAENCNFSLPIDRIQNICHCSINEYLHNPVPGKINILTPNICNGMMLDPNDVNKSKRKKVVFIGRLTKTLIKKINILSSHFKDVQFDIYGSKFFYKNVKFMGLGPHCPDRQLANARLKEMLPGDNLVFKKIVTHGDLYSTLNKEGYAAGLASSIHDFGYNGRQANSSSKFYDYIGAGIPALVEDIVPEAYYIDTDSNLGETYSNKNKTSMIKAFEKMIEKKFNYKNIIIYSNKNHFPGSRAATIKRHTKGL